MAKKDSLLGSIIKGTVDITANTIKTTYDVAEEIAKVGFKAATSKDAKKLYKKTGELFKFTPPKEKLTEIGIINYLTKEDQHIKDTYKSFWQNHLNNKYDQKSYEKFENHWRAICAQMVFGALAKSKTHNYFEIKEKIEKKLSEKNEEIIILINTRYNPSYSGVGPDVKSILNSECFDNKLNENSLLELDVGLSKLDKFLVDSLN